MPSSPLRKPVEVFFSYAHRDEPLRDELAKHLSILKQQGVIDVWHDREISAGSEWEDEINAHLNSADVILLLVSADFLASQYLYGNELPRSLELHRALERHAARKARVIPVILRPVDWNGTPFSKLQALPKNAKAITTWQNQDEAFTDVARGVRQAVEELNQQSSPPKPRNFDPQPVRARQGPPQAPSLSRKLYSSQPISSPSRHLSQITWGAITLIPFLWILLGMYGLEDTSSDTQDYIAKFVMGSTGGLLSGTLGAVAWRNVKPGAPPEQLLFYIFLCSITGGVIWSFTGGGNWITGLFVGGLTSFFTYWWIHRVCVKA